MTTLNDIARALGTTKSTVSKALNGAKDVSLTMQKSVLEKAAELGYRHPGRTACIPQLAVFVINMNYRSSDDFGFTIVNSFCELAEASGYKTELIPLTTQLQKSITYDAYMSQHNFSGGFFLGISLLDPWLKDFKTCKTPTALLDNHINANPRITHVGSDNAEGIKTAVYYLKSLGHEKIGYLSSALGSYVYRQRYRSFLSAMESCGLSANQDLTGDALRIEDCLSSHLPRLLKNGCTAILCSHDLLACSALVRCSEMGFSIPQDISIMGFDDIPLCQSTQPPLTTIHQDCQSIGQSAFYALESQLNHIPISALLMHTTLVARSSCSTIQRKN